MTTVAETQLDYVLEIALKVRIRAFNIIVPRTNSCLNMDCIWYIFYCVSTIRTRKNTSYNKSTEGLRCSRVFAGTKESLVRTRATFNEARVFAGIEKSLVRTWATLDMCVPTAISLEIFANIEKTYADAANLFFYSFI